MAQAKSEPLMIIVHFKDSTVKRFRTTEPPRSSGSWLALVLTDGATEVYPSWAIAKVRVETR